MTGYCSQCGQTGGCDCMTQTDAERVAESSAIGWKKMLNVSKWHYFDAGGRSLCGKWMTFGRSGEFGNDDSPDNCAKCRRHLQSQSREQQG